ncbi:hypothetical protein ABPG72_005468 [Tetrahymena utriculariae]
MQNIIEFEKCQKHRGQLKNILLFDKSNIQPLNCLSCAKIAGRNSSKIIDINQFTHSNEYSIFENFPPLEDENLYEQLDQLLADQENNYLDKSISQIQSYFVKLKHEIILKLDQQEDKIKNNIIQIFGKNDSLIERFNIISQKAELKNLYTQYNEESALRIKEIINQMYQNIKQNTQTIKQKVDEIMEVLNKFSLDQPLSVKNQLIQLIQRINFFQGSPINSNKIDKLEQTILLNIKPQKNINQIELLGFEKSKNYVNSQQILIEKLNTNEILIRPSIDGYGISYSNFILDPNKKYIFRLEMQPITENNSNVSFIIGLIKENQINDGELEGGIRLNFQAQSNSKLLSSSTAEQSNKNYEIRIHLQDKLFKIASLPRYHRVYELQNKETIKQNFQLRLAFLLYHSSHRLFINYFSEVDKFENNI